MAGLIFVFISFSNFFSIGITGQAYLIFPIFSASVSLARLIFVCIIFSLLYDAVSFSNIAGDDVITGYVEKEPWQRFEL
jgi:hypothetical protein